MELNDIKDMEKPLYYSNIVSIESSLYDLIMHFGLKKDRDTSEMTSNDLEVSVVMSLQHAKALHKVLGDNINRYEEMFGEINIEPKANE